MLCQFFVITLLFHASFAETKTTNGSQNECGTITSTGRELRDLTAKRGEIPWQALIYKKTTQPYMMICGGSLVRNDIVISVLFHASFAETKTTNGSQNECGTITSTGRELRDLTAKRGEIPWQALIYKKTTQPYMMICGGSLVRNDIVISVAVCFWSEEEKLLPAANFAVAVGKIYRPWDNNVDEAQKSDVKEIHIPLRFFGRAANYQDDIAVVKVASPFTYNSFVKPVCLSFDAELNNQQLQAGNEGKIGTWGVHETGQISPVLHVSNLPYIDIQTCVSEAPAEFHPYITSDKFCAGTLKPNSGPCRGDSGTGLSFPSEERYYLQGIASVSPVSSGGLCGDHGLTAFTTIRAHEDFIKQHMTEIVRKPAA